MNRLLIAMFTFPLMALCGVALASGIFLMNEGFKGTPVDIGRGLRGLGLVVLAVACFPSRRHILYRLWQRRRQPPVVQPQRVAVTTAPPQPRAALYDGRVRLDFVLPPGDPARVTSWIGGLPKLPRTMDWPSTRNGPMLFVAQIAMADLPRNIWGGLGPRTGSLAFFVHADDDFSKVAVLHVDGLLEERGYPAPLEVIQSYPHLKRGFGGELLSVPPDDQAPPLMKWPVRATPVDPEDELPSPFFKYRAPDNIAATHRKAASLADPAFIPYDWPTQIVLLSTLIGEMNGSIHREGSRPDMPDAQRQSQADRKAAAELLTAMRTEYKKRSRQEAFTPQHWVDAKARLEQIRVRSLRKEQNSETGQTTFHLLDPKPVLHTLPIHKYYSAFEYLSRGIYARDPDLLPDVVRASFEPVWRHDAQFEVSSMGGRINIAAHVTSSRDDLVCLLEVPCSELVGTIWHDLSSFGFFIDPKDLADGNLGRARGSMSE